MRAIRVLTIVTLTAAMALSGCDKKADGAKKDDKKAASKKAGDKAGPATMAAGDFFKEFNSLKPMEVMKKYRQGVTVSGKVLKTITEMDKSMKIWLDAGGGNWVSLKFADKGEAAKKKGLKKGADVSSQCKIGGGSGKFVALTNCTLK